MTTSPENNVVAFDGLDDAIIGTCSRGNDNEVVAYDFNKVVELFGDMGWSEDDIEGWIAYVVEHIPNQQLPVFVYLDDTVSKDIQSERGSIH